MGFLSHYEGTKRIDLDDGYWADVKLCLSEAERDMGQRAMESAVEASRESKGRVDLTMYRRHLVAASLVAWNIDEDDGTVWPLAPANAKMASLLRLPGPVFTRIWLVVDGLNSPDKAERARFRDSSDGSGPAGEDGSAEHAGLRDGQDVVAGAGPASAGPDGLADPQG